MTKLLGVYEAIAAIQGELAAIGISKDQRNTKQNYNFRGIDDVYAALSPLLTKHNLCIIPRAVERTITEKPSKSGGTLFFVAVKVKYDLVCADDSSKHTAIMYGEAMDTGDKATNKAMSAAYKYLCFQLFCIPTEGDNDADASTPEIAANGPGKEMPPPPHVVKEEAETEARRLKGVAKNTELILEMVAEHKQAVDAVLVEICGELRYQEIGFESTKRLFIALTTLKMKIAEKEVT